MTTTSHCLEVPQLRAFAQGTIAEAEAAAVRQHLQACGICATLAANLADDLSETNRVGPRDVHSTHYDLEKKEPLSAPSPTPLLPSGSASDGTGPAAILSPPLGPDELGRLGPYRVLRLLGRGGMGVVYQAEDAALNRPVAIKVLKQELADQGGCWERFLREARTLASIKHEHIVTVYHAGQEGKTTYLVMELLQGCSLSEHLKNVPQPSVAEILRLGRELAAGLAVVHQHGLIHRDIKPANVWVEAPHGRVKILDFGLARQVRDDAHLTQTGVVVGTPAYMSPEQARGTDIDQRSDLFSLGCIIYRLCTGVEPFHGPDTMSVLMALAADTPRPIEQLNPAIPRVLTDLVMHLLVKNPENRPATAAEVVARFEAMEQALRKSAPPKRFSEAAPGVGDPTQKTSARGVSQWTGLRIGLLLGGGLLAGVVAGLFGLQTAAEPNPPAKGKSSPTVEVSQEVKPQDDPNWQVEQRKKQAVETPQKAPKPAPPPAPAPAPDRQVREYLSDWQPTTVIGSPPGTGVKPPPPPPPGPGPGPGPKGGPPRGGQFGNPTFPMVDGLMASPFTIISVNGKVSPHGIGMHASPQGKFGYGYALNHRFDTFTTDVSLNDSSTRSPVALTFSVYGDGNRLWQSLPVTTRNQTQTCNVSVKGVEELQLIVTNTAGEPQTVMGAHSVWIEPQVVGKK